MSLGTIPADNFTKAKTVHIVKLLGKLRITGGVYFRLSDCLWGVSEGGTWIGNDDRLVYK